MLMGIRADESITRARSVLISSQENRPYIKQWNDGYSEGNLFKSLPIYDWRTADVWTAPAMFGWDYNRAYDQMEMAGISHHSQRCAPPYGEEPMRGLWMYSICWPEIWDKMIARVPGAATAARYSTTELYAFRDKPDKPADMTWPEFIRYWLMKHPEKYRAGVASRVQSWIKLHFKKTTDPLAVNSPHPITGISWNHLLMIALRGDYKNRKQAPMPPNKERAWERYRREIAGMSKEDLRRPA